MQPYYSAQGIEIFNSDCRAILPELVRRERPRLVLADPPYGMRLDASYKNSKENVRRKIKASRGYEQVVGDDEDYDPTPILEATQDVKEQLWWGADYYRKHLPAGGSWLAWDKRAGLPEFDYTSAEFELCWSKTPHHRGIARVRWFGAFGMEQEGGEKRVHPNQKPVALMSWCLQRARIQPGDLVLDPYMGCGPVALACKALGARYVGVEIVQAYCDVTIRRLNDEFLPALVDNGATLDDLPLFAR